eukprot:GHVL01018719.1.p1 GENE.GHVL01018719.1~~GHVL01018719.1.p1  ORF type:complete len:512 (+),score=98.64 GHVL01018719.1:38-1573(+)
MSRAEDRRRNFKKGVDADEARRKREDAAELLRKSKREENLQKKRNMGAEVASTGAESRWTPELLQRLVQGVGSSIPRDQFLATQQFRKLLSVEHMPPITPVIESGVVPRFVEFLNDFSNPDLQFEAAWALTNIASGTPEQTAVVIGHEAIPVFVKLLTSPNDDVREQAVWALGNIAGDSAKCRDLVLQAGALTPLLSQLRESEKFSMLRNATWALSNLCRAKPPPPFEWVSPSLGTLSNLVFSTDIEVLTDACWALSYLSDGEPARIEAIIQSGVSRRLVELLMHQSLLVQTPALRAVGNIVTGDDRQTQVIIQCGALPNLLSLLSSPKKGVRKEACWTISNITAGNKEQIQEVLNVGLIPPLVSLLSTAEFDIKKEAAWAISNATSGGSQQQVEYIVECGAIKPICDLLTANDTKIINVALEALDNILRAGKQKQKDANLDVNPYCALVDQGGGLNSLEVLQEDLNEAVYQKVVNIIENYFPFEDEEEDSSNATGFGATAAPPTGGFQFG